jgi:tetratricopeptide (TPR) repeat protein
MSYNNIGTIHYYKEDYDLALEYYQKALEIRKKVLGESHPDLSTSYNNIGAIYDAKEDYRKSLKYYQKALEICKQTIGEEHSETKKVEKNIEVTLQKLNNKK